MWDDYDDYYQGEIYPTKFHTVECSPGKSCSHTIPLWNDPKTNEIYNHPPQIISNNLNKQLNSADYYKKSTFRPLVKSTTTTTTSSPSTLGVSVASIYNQKWPSSSQISFSNQHQQNNYNSHHQSDQSQNHPMTSSPSYTQFEYSPMYADTVQEPVYNKYATNRYDPFIYHTTEKKVSKSRRPSRNRSSLSRLVPGSNIYNYLLSSALLYKYI